MYVSRSLQFQSVKWIYGKSMRMSVDKAAGEASPTVKTCHPTQPLEIGSMDGVLWDRHVPRVGPGDVWSP